MTDKEFDKQVSEAFASLPKEHIANLTMAQKKIGVIVHQAYTAGRRREQINTAMMTAKIGGIVMDQSISAVEGTPDQPPVMRALGKVFL